ncbi:UNVERIFIED_CONTAM: hypothetical protein HDU68_012165 [Siphonaria sp. JEL0065]|nr:hypothetical protein HDU68_012165 [Siphonaria sp. JEL0065]
MTVLAGEAYLSLVLGVISSLSLGFVILFILRVQLKNKAVTIKSVLTPFNAHLLLLAVSQNILNWAQIGFQLPLIKDSVANKSIVFIFRVIGGVLFEYSYLQYSFLRSEHILYDIVPNLLPYISFFILHCKYLFICNICTRVAASILAFSSPDTSAACNNASIYISVINGFFVLTVDIISLCSFISFLQKTRGSETDEPDKQFRIISIYGIAASSALLVALSFGLVYGIKKNELWNNLSVLFSTITFLVLFKMKVELHFEKMERLNQRLTVLNIVQEKT